MGVGAQGTEVTSLQTWLENNGYYSGPVTGYYGSLTMAAVERFQSANGISATGYVGPLTLAALNARASGTSTVSANSSTIAQLEAELDSLLAQIQTLEGNTTTSITTTIPTAQSTTLETNENTAVGATLGASGTSPFTYTITSSPLNGTITSFNPSTGAFTYTPNNNYSGTDTFSYTVGNSSGTSAPMTVTLDVGGANSGAPTGQALSFSTSNGTSYNGTLSASGNSPYTYTITSEPSHGSISNFNPSTGTFTYVPTSNYSGSDTFTYTVSNSAGVSSPVTVTVQNGSSSTTAPTGQPLSFSTANGAAVNGTLTASGSGPYTYQIVTNPSYGTIANFNSSTGTFTYIPTSATYTGTDSFTYTVSNGTGTSSAYTVTIDD